MLKISLKEHRRSSLPLYRFLADFSRSYANGFIDSRNKYLSVSTGTSLCSIADCAYRALEHRVRNNEENHHFGDEVDRIFTSPIHLGMTLLPSVTFNVNRGQAPDTQFGESPFYIFHLERLDNGLNFFHVRSLLLARTSPENHPELKAGRCLRRQP